MSDANDVLKYAAAGALLLASAAPAYYYIVYVPGRDAAAKKEADDQRATATLRADARRSRYDSCVAGATADYNATWNVNCSIRHKSAQKAYEFCKQAGGAEKTCAAHLDDAPEENCNLSRPLADGLNKDFHEAKDACLAEFKANIS